MGRIIMTILGEMDEVLLEKRCFVDPTTGSDVVEYWYQGQLVHRSAAVALSGVQGSGRAFTF